MDQRDHFPMPPEYEFVGELGRGGMARVFECECTLSKRRVAVKVSSPELDDAGVQLCMREAWLASRIRHPNVTRVNAYGKLGRQVWMEMEIIRGESLTTATHRPDFDMEDRIRVFRDVAEALAGLHSLGVVHRDVKSDNIMIRTDGSVCLIDLGIAKLESETQDGIVVGTPSTMPPERLLGQPNDRRSDIFQLAILAYDLFAIGRPWAKCADPFATAVKICTIPALDFTELLSESATRRFDVMMAISPLVMAALSQDPNKRPSDSTCFVEAIDTAWSLSIDMILPVWVDAIDIDPSHPSLEQLCAAA